MPTPTPRTETGTETGAKKKAAREIVAYIEFVWKQKERTVGEVSNTFEAIIEKHCSPKLTSYQEGVLKSAEGNHMWINAFACVCPTDTLKMDIGQYVLDKLSDKEALIFDYQDSENEAMRRLGKLTPQLVIRFNKS